MKLLRWLFVLPVGGAGLYLGIVSAILLVALLQRLCPLEDQVSGLCFADWYVAAESTAIAFGAALGAVCAVSLPALVAPAHKRHVSVLFYLAGSAVAVCFLASAGRSFLLPFGVAMSTGALAVVACFRRTQSATGPKH